MSIPSSQTFSRQSIYQLFKKKNEDLSYNSVSWIIEKGLKSNILFKVGSDSYSRREDTRKIYKPVYSSFATKVNKTIETHFPELQYTIFETFLLNEFVNHLYSQNIIVLQIEKQLCPFTFDFLIQEYPGKVLFNPSSDDFGRYKADNCIILENRVSEAPFDKNNPHYMTIEKLLVDCVSDKIIQFLVPNSEISNIFENANLLYKSELTKIRRYAKRRNAWNKIISLMKQENQDDK